MQSSGQIATFKVVIAEDPYAYVLSANVHRRHLTGEQKRELIAKLLKAQPEKSDRQIAETVKASPTTVGTVRAKMESAGDVSKLGTRQDTKGRQQPANKPKPPSVPAAKPSPRDDIGPVSTGETDRLRARNEELGRENHRLGRENIALRSEVEEAKAPRKPQIAPDGKAMLYCSFCAKSQHEVSRLIAGRAVFICDECVELCVDIIKESKAAEQRKPDAEAAPQPEKKAHAYDDGIPKRKGGRPKGSKNKPKPVARKPVKKRVLKGSDDGGAS